MAQSDPGKPGPKFTTTRSTVRRLSDGKVLSSSTSKSRETQGDRDAAQQGKNIRTMVAGRVRANGNDRSNAGVREAAGQTLDQIRGDYKKAGGEKMSQKQAQAWGMNYMGQQANKTRQDAARQRSGNPDRSAAAKKGWQTRRGGK